MGNEVCEGCGTKRAHYGTPRIHLSNMRRKERGVFARCDLGMGIDSEPLHYEWLATAVQVGSSLHSLDTLALSLR